MLRFVIALVAILIPLGACAKDNVPDTELLAKSGSNCIAIKRKNEIMATGTDLPFLTIDYSDSDSMWNAQKWRTLTPDSVTISHRGAKTTFNIPSFGGKQVSAQLEARTRKNTGLLFWQIQLKNKASGVVVAVNGPSLKGIKTIDDASLYYPDRAGHRLDNPWVSLEKSPYKIEYPVPASMQMLTYAGKSSGISLQVHDREMVHKIFSFGGPEHEMNVTQYSFIEPNKSWKSPPVIWQTFEGDWHKASDFYHNWFSATFPFPRVSEAVKQFPIMGGVTVQAGTIDDDDEKSRKKEAGSFKTALERSLQLRQFGFEGVELIGWFGNGDYRTYPDHLPSDKIGGESALKSLIDCAHNGGMFVLLYFDARVGHESNPTIIAHPEWLLKLAAGDDFRDKWLYHDYPLLCPSESGWQHHLKDQVLRVVRDDHADGVQLDQVGAAQSKLCFDRSHGHRTPATAWGGLSGGGYPEMLKSIRDEAMKYNHSYLQWIEGAWEGAGPWVDSSQGGFWKGAPGAVRFAEFYRYTFPEHPMMGDPRMGGIPFWEAKGDRHRVSQLNAAEGKIFLRGKFMDNIDLSCTPSAEVHWFDAGHKAVVTVVNEQKNLQNFELGLNQSAIGARMKPSKLRQVGSNKDLNFELSNNGLSIHDVCVPPGEVELVEISW